MGESAVPKPEAATSEKGQAIANVTDIAEVLATGLPDPSAPKPRTKSVRKRKQPMSPGDNGLRAFAAAPWFGRNAHVRQPTLFGSGGWGASR